MVIPSLAKTVTTLRFNLGGTSATALVAREGYPLALIEGSVPERDPDGNIVVDANGIPVASTQKQIYGIYFR